MEQEEEDGFLNHCLHVLKPEMDLDWYRKTYSADIEQLSFKGESPEAFYVRLGARMGHDPNPYFSEVYFRIKNSWIAERMQAYPREFGFLIYVMNRPEVEPGTFELAPFETTRLLRELYLGLDPEYLEEHYGDEMGPGRRFADFYIATCLEGRKLDPNAEFSEDYYIARNDDVSAAVKNGQLISGYQHYLVSGRTEGRLTMTVEEFDNIRHSRLEKNAKIYLEENFPGITQPREIGVSDSLSRLMRKLTVRIDPKGQRRLRVFVMQFFPEVFFGGYGAFFDFLRRMKAQLGIPVKLYVCGSENWRTHAENLERVRELAPNVYEIFDEIVLFTRDQTSVTISEDCPIVSYSAETHFLAQQLADTTGKLPYFFIQDDEAMFHPFDSVASFTLSAFEIPHYGIINSQLLLEHLYDSDAYPVMRRGDYSNVTFENKIVPLTTPRDEFLKAQKDKEKRKLVLYGRPENHAARNQFAFIVTALRRAVDDGLFDDNWEFWSIGSLDFQGEIELSKGLSIQQLTRVSKTDYEKFISTGDIGISMISTPHPGIIHFQMAAFGLTTITNTGFKRDKALFAEISGNIVPVRLSFDDLMRGLAEAKEKSADFEARYENAMATRAEYDNSTVEVAVAQVVADIQKGFAED